MAETYLSEWKPKNKLWDKLSRGLRAGRDFLDKAQVPEGVPLVGGVKLGEVLLDKYPEVAERMAYDQPLTQGTGFARQMHPDVSSSLVALAGNVSPGGKAGASAARMAAKEGGEQLLEQSLQRAARGGATEGATGMLRKNLPANADPADYLPRPTVSSPQRVAYPNVYLRPDKLVERARVAPEDPLLKQLFGVDRHDLLAIAEGGARAGNYPGIPFNAPAKGRGSAAAFDVMNPRNEQRLLDIMGEAMKREDLATGMVPWYVMDPAYQHFERLWGKERAPQEYARFNNITGMFSPQSEVLTELNRGTAANWLDKQGRLADFIRYGNEMGQPGSPEDMAAVLGHMGHSTSHLGPLRKYLDAGEQLRMDSAKVPSYIRASGVPETGFQTAWPVGDAHWSRLVGLPDTRGWAKDKKTGLLVPNAASASVPEMTTLGPWWRGLSNQMGLESVPGQALVWGAGSHATGVTSPIGAPKLELLAQQIGKTARRLGISPEQARDMVILGQTHAGLLGGGGTAAQLAKEVPTTVRRQAAQGSKQEERERKREQ